jgi:hypothetical protein
MLSSRPKARCMYGSKIVGSTSDRSPSYFASAATPMTSTSRRPALKRAPIGDPPKYRRAAA